VRFLAVLVIVATCACSPISPDAGQPDLGVPEPGPSSTAPPREWFTYFDEVYNFEFEHPIDVQIETQSVGGFQVLVYTDPENPFYIRATRDFLPGSLLYFLDTEPIGQRILGSNTWQAFHLPDGYGDAVGTSPPIYALQLEQGGVLYSATFYHQSTTTDLQDQILSTFRVLD